MGISIFGIVEGFDRVPFSHRFCISRKLQRAFRNGALGFLLTSLALAFCLLLSRPTIYEDAFVHPSRRVIEWCVSDQKVAKREVTHDQAAHQVWDTIRSAHEAEDDEAEISLHSVEVPDTLEAGATEPNVRNPEQHINRHRTQESLPAKNFPGDSLSSDRTAVGDMKVVTQQEAKKKPDAGDRETQEHLDVEVLAEAVPEIVHVPLEDVVSGMKLSGWEDDWVAHASYDNGKWGGLSEPKIDFVYLCKCV